MQLEPGTIWLVSFDPSVGHEYQKCRPALILSNPLYTRSCFTCVPITSNTANREPLDVFIQRTTENRLMLDSMAKVTYVTTFDQDRAVKYIGFVDEAAMAAVRVSIAKYIL